MEPFPQPHPLPPPEVAWSSAAGVQVAAQWWAHHLQGAVPIVLLTSPEHPLHTLLEGRCVEEDRWQAVSALQVVSVRLYWSTWWSHDTEVCHLAQALVSNHYLQPPVSFLMPPSC